MKTYKDIFGWFPEETVKALDHIIPDFEIKSVTEIGSFLGKSTVYFASKGLEVSAIDPFVEWEEGKDNDDAIREGGKDFFDKFLLNIDGYHKIFIHKGTSQEASELGLDKTDMIYIDGAHDYESVKQDIHLWDSHATKIICGDDYDDNWPGVKKAVDEFYGDKAKVEGRFWYVMKQSNDGKI